MRELRIAICAEVLYDVMRRRAWQRRMPCPPRRWCVEGTYGFLDMVMKAVNYEKQLTHHDREGVLR